MRRIIYWILAGLLIMSVAIGCQKKEEQNALSDEEVKETIVKHIKSKTTPEGTFAIEDTVEDKTWQLTYDHVHEAVHKTEDGRYYACVDFTEGENRLDLDVYVAIEDDKPEVSEVVIHKVNDQSRW